MHICYKSQKIWINKKKKIKIMYNPNIKGKPFLTSWSLSLSLHIYFFHFYGRGIRQYATIFFIKNNSDIFLFYQI